MPTNRPPLLGVVGLVMAAGLAATSGAVSAPATGSPVSAGSAQASSKIAFTQSAAGGQRKGGLYVMNADGSGKRRLAEQRHPSCLVAGRAQDRLRRSSGGERRWERAAEIDERRRRSCVVA